MITIETFTSGPFATNAYLLVSPSKDLAAIIDPAPDSAKALLGYLDDHNLTLNKILLTHSHWDHIADTAVVKAKYPDVPVCIFPDDAPNLEAPGSDDLPCWISITGVKPDHLFKDGEIISVGALAFEVIHTPGHTPGGVCFYCKEHSFLFSGDTLFKGTIGNLSLPTARPQLMWSSLTKLSKLPRETVVYPGHGPKTTIGEEEWLSDAKRMFGGC